MSPARDGVASAGARVGPALVGGDGVDPRLEAEHVAERAKKQEIAGALGAEAEVVAHDDGARVERAHDELADEALRRPRGEGHVEAPDEDALDPGVAHELHAAVHVRQDWGGPPADDCAWMRIEREHARDEPLGACVGDHLLEHGLVPAVDPVEIADDERARTGREERGGRGIVDDHRSGARAHCRPACSTVAGH